MELSAQYLHNKVILGLDFGKKVIGTATYQWGRDPYPMPFSRIINTGLDQVLISLQEIISDECIDIIVIGVPYLLDGQATPQTKKAQDFLKWVRDKCPDQKCFEQDETLSTFEAEERMKNSARYNFKIDIKQIDSLSASIILEDFVKGLKENLENED